MQVPCSWFHVLGPTPLVAWSSGHKYSVVIVRVLLPLGGWLGGVTKKYCTDAYIKIMRPLQIPMKRTGKDRNTFQEGLDFLPVQTTFLQQVQCFVVCCMLELCEVFRFADVLQYFVSFFLHFSLLYCLDESHDNIQIHKTNDMRTCNFFNNFPEILRFCIIFPWRPSCKG